MADNSILTGEVLISKPNILGDEIFNRALILIADSNKQGVVGFMLNKPLEERLTDLVPTVKADIQVFNGGPVERDKLYFIHTIPDLITGGLHIRDNIYWGGDYQSTIELLNQDKIKTSEIKFFLGYAGWQENQLESEIEEDVWFKAKDFYEQDIITCNHASIWNKKMKSMGGEYLLWSNAPENPSYN